MNNELTDEQLIRACAELDGFENVDIYIKGGPIPFCISALQGTRDGLGESEDTLGREMFVVPDYLNSRDAIIGVIENLHPTIVEAMIIELQKVLEKDWQKKGNKTWLFGELKWKMAILTATPRRLATALVRATGKDKK